MLDSLACLQDSWWNYIVTVNGQCHGCCRLEQEQEGRHLVGPLERVGKVGDILIGTESRTLHKIQHRSDLPGPGG